MPDVHGNLIAEEGCDRCTCGCKYWEHDQCIDCGTHIEKAKRDIAALEAEGFTP